jgi:hypothetical protein
MWLSLARGEVARESLRYSFGAAATPADGVTFLNCGPAQAARIGLAAAGGKNLEVLSPTIGRQLLELGMIDEIDLHIAPILLGEGIRLYDNPRH